MLLESLAKVLVRILKNGILDAGDPLVEDQTPHDRQNQANSQDWGDCGCLAWFPPQIPTMHSMLLISTAEKPKNAHRRPPKTWLIDASDTARLRKVWGLLLFIPRTWPKPQGRVVSDSS